MAGSQPARAAPGSGLGIVPADDPAQALLKEIAATGSLRSPIVQTLLQTEGLTKYETDLLDSYSLLVMYGNITDVPPQVAAKEKEFAQKVAPSVTALLGNNQLPNAVLSAKVKEVPKTETTAFKGPPIPGNLFNHLPEQKKPTGPTEAPQKKPDAITALTDVPEKDAAVFRPGGKAASTDTKKDETKKPRPKISFGLEHKLTYNYTRATGATVYETEDYLDVWGNPTKAKYTNNRVFTDEIIGRIYVDVSDALKVATGFRAYNPNGMAGSAGTTFGIDNIVATVQEKTRLTFGRFSESFGKYNVNLSDIKGFEYDYTGEGTHVTAFTGKTGQYTNPYVVPESPKSLWGIQYTTNKLAKNLELSFAYATGKEVSTPSNRNSVFTVAFNGKVGKGDLSGEISRGSSSQNGQNYSVGAMFATYSTKLAKNVAMTVNAVNVGSNYSSFVQKSTGTGYATVDGRPDYPYPAGQKGIDVKINAVLQEGVSNLALYLQRYSSDEDGNTGIHKYAVAWDHALKIFDRTEQRAAITTALRIENSGQNGVGGTRISGAINSSIKMAKDIVLTAGYTFARGNDGENGNETNLATGLSKTIQVTERLSVVPSVSFEYKKGSGGTANKPTTAVQQPYDSRAVEGKITTAYKVIPGELTATMTFARSLHRVNQAQIDPNTGQNLDGESRNVSGVAIGIDWQNKAIPGLTTAVSIGKNKVTHLDKGTTTNQTAFSSRVTYSQKVGDNSTAQISYDYARIKDSNDSSYDQLLRTAGAQLNLHVGKKSTLTVNHTSQKVQQNNNPSGNSDVTQTTVEMVNKF